MKAVYNAVGDITLADAFYEFLDIVKKSMDSKILSGENIKSIKLVGKMHKDERNNPEFTFDFDLK